MAFPATAASALNTKSQVTVQQAELVAATEALHGAIDVLSTRLAESVLRNEPEPELPALNTGQPVRVLVALASFLETRVDQVKLATNRINSIVNRLEI